MESNHEQPQTVRRPVSFQSGSLVLGLILGLAVAMIALPVVWLIISENRVMDSADGTFRSSGVSLRGKYYAHVWLRVSEKRPKIMYDVYAETNYLNDRNAQPFLIRSSIVLGAALQQPGIAQLSCLRNEADKTDWLARNLDVRFLGDSEILQIAIAGEKPEELVKILLAVRAAYMDQVVAVDRDMDVRRRMTLENAYKNMEKLISRKEIQLKNLSEQLGEPGSRTAHHANIFATKTVDTLQNRIFSLTAEIDESDKRIAILKGRLSLLTKKAEAEKKETEEASDEQPPLPPEAEKLLAEIEIAESDRDVLKQILDTAVKSLKQAVTSAECVCGGSTELSNLRAELERMKKMYYQMGTQLDEWTIEAQAAARVQPINEPEIPRVRR